MKKKTLMMGILGILLVFSLTFTACSSGGDDSNTSNVSADFTPTALQSGLTLSAQKNNDTGVITVTLRGTISQPGDFEAQFSPGGPDKPAGNYAYVNFSLASVIMPVADEVIAIRQDNDALRYYANTDT
ncbi:MAG: hypothetical protein LBK40_00840, partial [Spirochaetaceae bacterium]|nr:hypothetical protein [Spirochaetaceae bacterium]